MESNFENGELKAEILKELKDINEQKNALEKREKALKKAITDEAKAFTYTTTNYGGIQVQVVAPYFELVFDSDLFAQENPELFAKYKKVVYHEPTYKIVFVKGK